MMATTHAFAGLLFAIPVSIIYPEFAMVTAFAALIGGMVPDLDLVRGMVHRYHLHYPEYGLIGVAIAATATIIAPSAATFAATMFLASAWLHARMDMYGGGLEARPWEGNSDRAVYFHRKGAWAVPQRIIRYDGAPEDLALAGVLAVPSLLVFDDVVQVVIMVLLGISAIYTTVRKKFDEWGLAERLEPIFLGNHPDEW